MLHFCLIKLRLFLLSENRGFVKRKTLLNLEQTFDHLLSILNCWATLKTLGVLEFQIILEILIAMRNYFFPFYLKKIIIIIKLIEFKHLKFLVSVIISYIFDLKIISIVFFFSFLFVTWYKQSVMLEGRKKIHKWSFYCNKNNFFFIIINLSPSLLWIGKENGSLIAKYRIYTWELKGRTLISWLYGA